ncbi:hypothetical protein ACI68E_003512 [Malassezia pachydermatis]
MVSSQFMDGVASTGLDPPKRDHASSALTEDNVGQIPEADQLAPGIRLPQQSMPLYSMYIKSGSSISTGLGCNSTTAETMYSELGAECSSVPPELDPRTTTFQPSLPSEASICSVDVNPGTPRSKSKDILRRAFASPSSNLRKRKGTPSIDDEAAPHMEEPGGYEEQYTSGHSATQPDTISLANSEAGSFVSETSGLSYPDAFTEDEQAIEQQRMEERIRAGGDLGIGGQVSVSMARMREKLSHPTATRTLSTSATASNSPAPSIFEDETSFKPYIPDTHTEPLSASPPVHHAIDSPPK